MPQAVWLATAMLQHAHRKDGLDKAFSVESIRERVVGLEIGQSKNLGYIDSNITTYCVANHEVKSWSPKHCQLYRVGHKMYRLYRRGKDIPHSSKRDICVEPPLHNIPAKLRFLIEWYRKEYCSEKTPSLPSDSSAHDPAGEQTGRAAADSSSSARKNAQNGHAVWECAGMVDVLGLKDGPPPWATEAVTRAVRNTTKVRRIKNLYDDKCQVCGHFIPVTPDHKYSEVHHLRPLRSDGDDDLSNMLVLCPTHHVEFDYAVLGVSKDGYGVVDRNGSTVRPLTVLPGHALDPKNIMFHLERMNLAQPSGRRELAVDFVAENP